MRLLLALLLVSSAAHSSPWPQQEGLTVANETASPVQVVMCDPDGSHCSAPRVFAPAEAQNCGWWIFNMPDNSKVTPKPPLRKCDKVAVPIPPATIDVCMPAFRLDFWNMEFETGPVPPNVSITNDKYIVWHGKCGKFFAATYSRKDQDELEQARPNSEAAWDAWGKGLPLASQAESVFLQQKIAQYKAKLGIPPPVPTVPPPPQYAVQSIASGMRPYYAPNSTLTAVGKKLGDVATNTACDGSKRLGTTNYYWVPSVGGYSVCVAK